MEFLYNLSILFFAVAAFGVILWGAEWVWQSLASLVIWYTDRQTKKGQ